MDFTSEPAVKLDHLVILASDLARSAAWYDRLLPLLGFRRLRAHVYANDDGLHLDLRSARPETGPYQRHGPGLNHLGFTAQSREQIEAVAAALVAHGITVPALQQFGNDVALFLPDPDGLRVELSTYG